MNIKLTRNKDWLKYSEELIEIGDLLMKNGKYSWACFTLEQASSAALKAILSNKEESTFGENLIKLLNLIKNLHSVPDDVKDACHYLNDYFSKTRDLENTNKGTPSDHFTLKDAMQVKKQAMAILRFAYHITN